MQQSVALIGESDRALRELMRRALEGAGYGILEIASSAQLEAEMRNGYVTSAPGALLAVSASMFDASAAVVVAFARWRAAINRPVPHVLLTCEFGTLRDFSPPDLGECAFAGILEKPFDLTLLQSVACRCRSAVPTGHVSI